MKNKIESLTQQFSTLSSKEALYQEIMKWGTKLAPFEPNWKTDENRVVGCQSLMYLHTTYEQTGLYFFASSDALISAGLAALLIFIYNGESPECILKNPPHFLEEIGIPSALSPGRANGLASLYRQMQKQSLKYLMQQA